MVERRIRTATGEGRLPCLVAPRGTTAALRRRVQGAIASSLALAVLVVSCQGASGPGPIRLGSPCSICGMGVQDLRFACGRRVEGQWRVYDAIECLMRDSGAGGPAWVADYDQRALGSAESLWVVRGEFPSPMGGGYAAFRERTAAEEIASRTRGRVGRLADFADREGRP